MGAGEQWLRTLILACERSLDRLPENDPASFDLRDDIAALLARLRADLAAADRNPSAK